MQIFKRISFKTLKCNFVLRTFDSIRRLNYLFNDEHLHTFVAALAEFNVHLYSQFHWVSANNINGRQGCSLFRTPVLMENFCLNRGNFCLLSSGTPFKNVLDPPPPLNMSSYRKMFNDLWKCLNIEIVSTIMTFKLKKLYILTLFSVAFGHNFLIFLFFM